MEIRLDPKAVEAAATAMDVRLESRNPLIQRAKIEAAEAGIRAFLDALGARVDDDDGHNECYRLVTDWRPRV